MYCNVKTPVLFLVAERPQHMLMRVSVGIHKEDIDAAIETYNLLSERWFTHASPTLFNAGTNRPQLSRYVSSVIAFNGIVVLGLCLKVFSNLHSNVVVANELEIVQMCINRHMDRCWCRCAVECISVMKINMKVTCVKKWISTIYHVPYETVFHRCLHTFIRKCFMLVCLVTSFCFLSKIMKAHRDIRTIFWVISSSHIPMLRC